MLLTLNELVYVGSKIENQNDMSFFKNLKVAMKGDEIKSLEAKGLIKDGVLSGALLEASLVMAKAEKAARLVMQVPGAVIEKGVYTLGALQVLVETVGNGMNISFLGNFDDIRFEISDHVGMTDIKHVDIEYVLDGASLLVATSLIDWIRQGSLRSYVEDVEVAFGEIDGLKHYLSKPLSKSVTGLLTKLYGVEMPDFEAFEREKELLVEKGVITLDGNKIMIQPELQLFSNHFLMPDVQIVLEAFDARKLDTVVAASNVVLCSGIKDILAFNATTEGVEMKSLSSVELLKRIEGFLACPDLI